MSDKPSNQEPQSWSAKQKQTEKRVAYIFGLVFIVTLLILAIAFPEPTAFQYVVFRIVLSLAAAGCASMIPGFIEVEISTIIRAGGALAVFVLVYFYNPAELVLEEPVAENPWIAEINTLRGNLGDLEGIWHRLSDGETPCDRVQEEASTLGSRFINIQDSDLDGEIAKQIEKYRYAQYAYLMGSDVECDIEKAKEYAQESLNHGATALVLIEQANQEPGDYGQALRDWLDDDFAADRIHFHNALGHSLLYRYGQQDQIAKAEQALSNIRSEYYTEAGVTKDGNRILEPVLQLSPQNNELLFITHPCKVTCDINRPS